MFSSLRCDVGLVQYLKLNNLRPVKHIFSIRQRLSMPASLMALRHRRRTMSLQAV